MNPKVQPSKIAKGRLYDMWPDLCHHCVWIFDSALWLQDVEFAKDIIHQSRVDKNKYRGEDYDCDDFAAELYVDYRKRAQKHNRTGKPAAFGRIMGWRFNNANSPHAINIFLTANGIYLVEPQDDSIWEATHEKDRPFFIEF